MKTIILWWSFIKKHFVPMVITALLLTVSMFAVTTFYGQYLYMTYTRDVLLRSNLQNGGYLMNFYSYEDFEDGDSDPIELMEKYYTEQKKTIESFAACKYVLKNESFYIGDTSGYDMGYHCFPYDKNHRLGFPLDVDKGRWLSENPTYTEAVIAGNYWDKKVGDVLHLEGGLSATVVGIIEGAAFCPDFGHSSNSNCPADSLFRTAICNVYISKETVEPQTLSERRIYSPYNCYVVFDENASKEDLADLTRYLESQGVFAPYSKIITDSNKEIDDWLYLSFPLPVFLAAVCTISILCICTVIIKRSMNEYSKYYLMGCTKRKIIYLVTAPMIISFGLPCAINLLSVLVFPHFLRAGEMYFYKQDYILDHRAAIIILIYWGALAVLLVIMPMMFYRKYSPLSLYRRNL